MYKLYTVVVDNLKVVDIGRIAGRAVVLARDKLVFLGQLLGHFVLVFDFGLGYGSCEDGIPQDGICRDIVEDKQRIRGDALVGYGGLVGGRVTAQCLLDIISEMSVVCVTGRAEG